MAVTVPRKTRGHKISPWFPVIACLLLAGTVWLGFRQYEAQQRDNHLFMALQAADPLAVRAALDAGADPNGVIAAGPAAGGFSATLQQWLDEILRRNLTSTALTVAVSSQNPQCVHLLLDKGADPNRPNSDGGTPLTRAATFLGEGDTRPILIMQMLLDKGADINAKNLSGETALGDSINENGYIGPLDLTVPRFLLTHGAKADVVGRSMPGDTLLQSCVRSGSKNTVPLMNLLLDHGADPNQKDGLGWPILLRASQWITPEIVKSLLDHGANPNTDPTIDETPLREAVRQGQVGTIRLLLAKGADVNVTGGDGNTALTEATIDKRADIAKLLLTSGAKPNLVSTKAGRTPALIWAVLNNDVRSVRLLLTFKADVNCQDDWGNTPLGSDASADSVRGFSKLHGFSDPSTLRNLWPVSHRRDLTIARLLLAAGAEVNKPGNAQNTVLIYAVAGHNLPLVRLLLTHNANPNALGSAGETPLTLAQERGCTDLLPLLQLHH